MKRKKYVLLKKNKRRIKHMWKIIILYSLISLMISNISNISFINCVLILISIDLFLMQKTKINKWYDENNYTDFFKECNKIEYHK